MSLLSLANYNLTSQGKICSSHGGLAIYLFKKYDHKTLTLYNHSDIWEGQLVEIAVVTLHKNIVIGNIYRPPKDLINNYRNFKEQLIPVFGHLHSIHFEAVIAGAGPGGSFVSPGACSLGVPARFAYRSGRIFVILVVHIQCYKLFKGTECTVLPMVLGTIKNP